MSACSPQGDSKVDTAPYNPYDRSSSLATVSNRSRSNHLHLVSSSTDSTASNRLNPLYLVPSGTGSKDSKESSQAIASTEPHKNEYIYPQIEYIFGEAKNEYFEDGMESRFSRKLISLIRKYKQDAIEAITCLIVYEKVNSEVAGEALRWIGRMEHAESYMFRRWLLERSITLSSIYVKEGAILGIASMDDKHAIKYLQKAIEIESCNELKADMQQVLEQLES
jgi:hypothetical protein